MKLKSCSVDTHGQQNHSQVKQLERVRKDNEENNMDWLRTGSSGVLCDVLAFSRHLFCQKTHVYCGRGQIKRRQCVAGNKWGVSVTSQTVAVKVFANIPAAVCHELSGFCWLCTRGWFLHQSHNLCSIFLLFSLEIVSLYSKMFHVFF